jgi:hypothetical protein
VQWWLATAGAIALGLATNTIYDVIKYRGVQVPRILDRRSLMPQAAGHDPAMEGLYPLVTWSSSRPLTPQRLVTKFAGRSSRSHVFDIPDWHREVVGFEDRGAAGRTAYVTELAVDTGEHPRAQHCHVTISESTYAECLASKRLLNSDPELADHLLTVLGSGYEAFVAVTPPTMVSACIAVISRGNRTLTLRRSISVTTYPGQWTIGINESMKYSDEPGAEEDFYGLVRRGLHEELGLDSTDYSAILISWFGWSQDASCYAIVAIVRSILTEPEIERRRQGCHSIYEHDLARWLPLRRRSISGIVTGGRPPDGRGSWNYLTPLVASEVWRCRHYCW